MLIAALTSTIAVIAGAALALGGVGARALVPLRSFALAAVVTTVVAHLLPEALGGGGTGVLLVFAAAAVAPALLGRLGSGRGDHALHRGHGGAGGLGVELAYASLLLHKLTDGVALAGALGGDHGEHWDVVLAVAGHTVPMAATVALAYRARGVRTAWLRTLALAAMMIAGALLADVAARAGSEGVVPWLNAAAGGLLLHVVIHDLPAPGARSAPARLAEVLAIAVGIAMPLIAVRAHAHDDPLVLPLASAFAHVALTAAPLALVGLLAGAGVHAWATRIPLSWLDGHGALRGAIRGALAGGPLPVCACGVLPVAGVLERRSVGVAAVVAFLLASPQLGAETVALTARFLGGGMAALRLGGAIAVAIVAGLVAARIARRGHGGGAGHGHGHGAGHGHGHGAGHGHGHGAGHGSGGGEPAGPIPHRLRRFAVALDAMIVHTGPWLLAGLIVAAYVDVLVPAGALAVSPWTLTPLLIALIAVPSHVCAIAATPLAAVLIAKGLSPGAALAGLLLGPATGLVTLAFLRRLLGAGATLFVLAIGVAGIGAVAAVAAVTAPPLPVASPPTWPSWLAAVLLVLLAARTIWSAGLAAWVAALHGHHEGDEHDADHGHVHEHGHAHDHGDHH